MHPADLTPVEIVDLLETAYREDRNGPPSGLAMAERTVLRDFLGCHEDARAEVWDLWRAELELSGGNLGDAEYWLDVEFVGPCEGERDA